MPNSRRSFLGWMVAAAAALLLAGSFEVGRFLAGSRPELRSEHARSGSGVPPDMMVVIAADGKTFHAPGCRFIHAKAKLDTVAAREAIRQRHAPCVRCMRKHLKT